MKTYSWRTWGGRPKTVEAASVTFEPQHVVFWDEAGELVLAVGWQNVHDLKIAKAEDDS